MGLKSTTPIRSKARSSLSAPSLRVKLFLCSRQQAFSLVQFTSLLSAALLLEEDKSRVGYWKTYLSKKVREIPSLKSGPMDAEGSAYGLHLIFFDRLVSENAVYSSCNLNKPPISHSHQTTLQANALVSTVRLAPSIRRTLINHGNPTWRAKGPLFATLSEGSNQRSGPFARGIDSDFPNTGLASVSCLEGHVGI